MLFQAAGVSAIGNAWKISKYFGCANIKMKSRMKANLNKVKKESRKVRGDQQLKFGKLGGCVLHWAFSWPKEARALPAASKKEETQL